MNPSDSSRTQLDLDKVFAALEAPLDLVDGEERRADLQRFVRAARVHQERAIFDLVSDVVAAVNAAGAGPRARLEYDAGQLYLTVPPENAASDEAEPMFRLDGDVEKVTIRLPAHLKRLIDEAASARGVSVNSWYIRTLGRALHFQIFRNRQDEEPNRGPGGHGARRAEVRWEWHGPPGSPPWASHGPPGPPPPPDRD